LATSIQAIHENWSNLKVEDFGDPFKKRLAATYLHFAPQEQMRREFRQHQDERGSLFEVIKSDHFGQIFVSTSRPGVVRGNHYHNTKVEKFCVLQGEATIRLRAVDETEIKEFSVTGENPSVVDIPPGYTHNIENVGSDSLVTLFWSNEVFDPEASDTYPCEV